MTEELTSRDIQSGLKFEAVWLKLNMHKGFVYQIQIIKHLTNDAEFRWVWQNFCLRNFLFIVENMMSGRMEVIITKSFGINEFLCQLKYFSKFIIHYKKHWFVDWCVSSWLQRQVAQIWLSHITFWRDDWNVPIFKTKHRNNQHMSIIYSVYFWMLD